MRNVWRNDDTRDTPSNCKAPRYRATAIRAQNRGKTTKVSAARDSTLARDTFPRAFWHTLGNTQGMHESDERKYRIEMTFHRPAVTLTSGDWAIAKSSQKYALVARLR